MLISCNIPISKIQNPQFKKFVEKWTKEKVPDESTLRKTYLRPSYEYVLNNIRKAVGNLNIFASIDETTDALGRYIVNTVIGTLSPESESQVFLLHSDEIEKANSQTICMFFDESMKVLWPDGIRHEKVLLFTTDAAPYMVKAAKSISDFYPKCIHVTCMAHSLNRLAEKIQDNNKLVNDLISQVKKIYVKAPERRRVFQEICSIPLPPQPVITRWSSWINAAFYYADHFEVIADHLKTLNPSDSRAIADAQEIIKNPELKQRLSFLKMHLQFLPEATNQLEARRGTLVKFLKVVEDVKEKTMNIPGPLGNLLREKILKLLEKNIGLKKLMEINKVCSGHISEDPLLKRYTVSDMSSFKYANPTSVEVERSFSKFKQILSDRRYSFSVENLRMHLVIASYSSIKLVNDEINNYVEENNDPELLDLSDSSLE